MHGLVVDQLTIKNKMKVDIKNLEKELQNFSFDMDSMIKNSIYAIKPTDTHLQIVELFNAYMKENERWQRKGYAAAGVRARKSLMAIKKLIGIRRQEMLDIDNANREELHQIINNQ
jgi:hypothetical protein